jgi:hypothetical protein
MRNVTVQGQERLAERFEEERPRLRAVAYRDPERLTRLDLCLPRG